MMAPTVNYKTTIEGISQVVEARRKRLLRYPLLRLKRGTGVVFASAEWGKLCRPKSGLCTKWSSVNASNKVI